MKNNEWIVVLGPDDKGKPHAAKFHPNQEEAVRKAAKLMGFRIGLPKTEEAIAVVDRLPPGKLFATGKGMVPFCPTASYAKLTTVLEMEPEPKAGSGAPQAEAAAPNAAKPTTTPAMGVATDPWAALKVGDKVIAPEKRPTEDGYWPCTISSISKDGRMLTLRWIDNPKQPPVVLKRRAVALLSNG